MKKKKILFVINTMGGAGAEAALLSLFGELSPEKYELSLFVVTGQGELVHRLPEYVTLKNKRYDDSSVLSAEGKKRLRKNILRQMFQNGAVFRNLPYLIRNSYSMIRKGKIYPDKLLWRVLSDGAGELRETYDLAVAYLEGGSAYYVRDHVRAKKKAVFIHIDYIRAGYTRALDKECYRYFHRIFAVSEDVKKQFLKVYPECAKRTDIFYNIVNQDEIRRKATLPGGFNDNYDGIRILTVGRLTAQKSYEIAIEAMRLLKQRGIKARWYVLGEGEERRKLEELIGRYGLRQDFLLLGAVSNPYPYYARTDLYVHATRFEGKSIAIQEAQSLGCPVLVSDSSGNRGQVTDGVDGRMCKLTPESVCDIITEMLSDREKMKLYGENEEKKRISNAGQIRKLLQLVGE